MTKITRLRLAIIPCLFFAIGCAAVQEPTAAIRSMKLGDISAEGFTMNFAIDIHNPNNFQLPLTNADYKLGLAGVNVLNDKAPLQGAIPANGDTSTVLPIKLTYSNLLQAEKAIVQTGGNVPFSFDTGLDFGQSGPIAVLAKSARIPSLSYNGTLPLKDLLKDPSVLMRNPDARKLATQILENLSGLPGR